MSTEKKLLILMAVIIVAFLLPIVYMGIAITSTEKDTKLNVTASNGVEFKGVYTLHSFPDESYDIRLYGKNKEFIYLFGGDGSGNKYIEIDFLCSNGNFDYYKAIHENRGVVYDELFVYNEKESFIIEDDKKHIAKHYDSILMFNDHEGETFELFIPAAKHQILNDNNGDYIGAYGERLIVDGNKEILEKIRFLVENPDVIKHDICSKEEIISRCQELLQKYGGEQ